MSTLTAHLTRTGTDASVRAGLMATRSRRWSGSRSWRPAERGIGLWDGNILVGIGVLRCVDGTWNGNCTEHAGIVARIGRDDALTFEDAAQ